MILLLISMVLAVLAYVLIKDYRRLAQLRYMAQTERACRGFAEIRHELVLALARGEIQPSDEKAFRYLHVACTRVLHTPSFFREISTAVCVAVAQDALPEPQETLASGDLSPVTRPLLERFVAAMDGLIGQFAHPLLAVFAAMNGISVTQFVLQLREARREIDRRRQGLERLRMASAKALAA